MKASRSCSGISKAASRSGAGHPPVRSARRRASASGQAGDPHPLEETGQLAHLEAQRIRAHLDQLPARPQPGHAQRRVGAARHDQLDPGRAVAQERLHLGVHVGVLGEVVVVQDDHHVPVAFGQLVEQDGQHRVDDPTRTGAQRRQRPGADGGIRACQRGDEMAPQPDRFGIAAVQRHPGEGMSRVRVHPFGQQCGFAESGRRGHQCQGTVPARAQPVQQLRTAHRPAGQPMRSQLGGNDADLDTLRCPTRTGRPTFCRHPTSPVMRHPSLGAPDHTSVAHPSARLAP